MNRTIRGLAANIAGKLLPGTRFIMPAEAGTIYLTFDDGPHPETTPRILELLAKHDAKATFFCLGMNVKKYPAVYDSILAEGHTTGNHSYSHLNGWATSTKTYLDDVRRASGLIRSTLFRPPYGRMTPGQYLQLRKDYEIIMWTRQFPDYKPRFNPEKIDTSKIANGGIVVMHDSLKAIEKTIKLLNTFVKNSRGKTQFKSV